MKLKKDRQKTEKELTGTIYVQPRNALSRAREINDSLSVLAGDDFSGEVSGAVSLSSEKKELSGDYKGIVVYESNTGKARKLIPLFLAVAFGLLCLVMMWKK